MIRVTMSPLLAVTAQANEEMSTIMVPMSPLPGVSPRANEETAAIRAMSLSLGLSFE